MPKITMVDWETDYAMQLVDGGFVRDAGYTRTHDGREHIVWEAVPWAQAGGM